MTPHNGKRNATGDLVWTEPTAEGGRRVVATVASVQGGEEQQILDVPLGQRLEVDITDSGQVFVHRIYGDGQDLAPWYVWDDGVLNLLPDGFQPADGNASGLVVGTQVIVEGSREDSRAVTWEDGELTLLPDLSNDSFGDSHARAVNDDGLIVGDVARHDPDPEREEPEVFAAMWRDDALVQQVAHARSDAQSATLNDVNEAGDAVGYEGLDNYGARYPLVVAGDSASLLQFEGSAAGISDAGDVVGDTRAEGPFLRHGGHTYLLHDLASDDSAVRMSTVYSGGADGTLRGFGRIGQRADGFFTFREMIGRPEPATRRAALTATQDYVHGGSAEIGASSRTTQVRIYNVGSAPVDFDRQVSGPAAAEVQVGLLSGPRQLPPGGFWTVQLTYTPGYVGTRSSWVEFPAGGGGARILFEAVGTARPGPEPSEEPTTSPAPSPSSSPTDSPTPSPSGPPSSTPPKPPTVQMFTMVRKPHLYGTPRVGRLMTAVVGLWRPQPTTVRYQWYRDGKAIKQAAKSTYRMRVRDLGHRITAKVKVARPGYITRTTTTAPARVRR